VVKAILFRGQQLKNADRKAFYSLPEVYFSILKLGSLVWFLNLGHSPFFFLL